MHVDRQDSTRKFQIRAAQLADALGIAACLSAAFAPYRDQYSPGAFADTVLDSDGVRQRMNEMQLFVAVSGEAVIGTIGCQAKGDEGHLRGMAVLPGWQGAGIASGLLNAAELELRKTGCRLITLDTTAPLAGAVEFYRRHGYTASGAVADFFGMPLYEYRKGLH